MTRWRSSRISADGRFHEIDGVPLYAQRFDEVLSFHEPGLAAVRIDGRAWHIDECGSRAYAREFHRTFGFYEGRASVQDGEDWFHILADGRSLTCVNYAWCGNFQGKRCTVRRCDGRYLHIDADGIPIADSTWKYAGDFRDGIAVVQGDDGLSTHIDANGRFLHGRRFRDLDVFHKGFARARDDRGWFHLGRDGASVYERRFAMIEPFYNGQARVERDDGALEVIDERGATVLVLREGEFRA